MAAILPASSLAESQQEQDSVPGAAKDLVGRWVEIEGRGVGLVVAFHKVWNQIMYDSPQNVELYELPEGRGTQRVLLRRYGVFRANNSGLEFAMCSQQVAAAMAEFKAMGFDNKADYDECKAMGFKTKED